MHDGSKTTEQQVTGSNVSVSYEVFADTLAVVEECAEATAVQVIQDCYEKMLVELKGCRELQEEQKRQISGKRILLKLDDMAKKHHT